jgi:hyperosmotically inducible periplasmic protein
MRISKLPLCAALGLLLLNGCSALDDDITVGESIDDASITAQVKAALVEDDDLSALDINVDTRQGVVSLSGVVDEPSDIARATELANDVAGVKSIQNNLRVD